MRPSRWLLGPALALALASLPAIGAHAAAGTPDRQPPRASVADRLHGHPQARRTRLLPRAQHGRAALRALGAEIGAAAERNHLSTSRLTTVLRTDHTAWISTTGRLFYAETDMNTNTVHPIAADIAPPSYPLTDTFLLHSKPGSKHTMYLDFDGYTLADTADWVTQTNGAWPATTFQGFSIDGDYGTFSDTEKAYVQEVWRIIAEKYAAFDVDVTTELPGADALNRNGPADKTYGNRVVFTNDANAKPVSICPDGCLGIAFVGSFNDPYDNADLSEPAWVYTSTLTNSPSFAANVGAHEAGHNLGLLHDGTNADGADSYYPGQGNWFPIMGAGTFAVGQFSKGEYADANQTQDDLAVIAATGAPERTDDYGDAATPTTLGQQASYTVDGVISDRNDVDSFTVDRSTCVGDLAVSATGIGEGQALDIRLTVKNSLGSTIADVDPASGQDTSTTPATPTGMDASTTITSAPADTYTISVDGVGHGDPVTDGYSDYGSIGQYHLTIGGCAGAGGQASTAPTSVAAAPTARTTTALLTWAPPSNSGAGVVTGYRISGVPEGSFEVGAGTFQHTLTGLVPGTSYDATVQAITLYGAGDPATVSVTAPSWAPTAAPAMRLYVSKNLLTVYWTPPANPGNASLDTWRLTINGQNFYDPLYLRHVGYKISGFRNGTYTAKLAILVTADLGTVTPTTTKSFRIGPTPPRIGRPSPGAIGGALTATVRWLAPTTLGGYPVTGYKAIAYKLNASGQITRSFITGILRPSARSFSGRLPAGRYKFRVVVYNALGQGPLSAYSTAVRAR